MEAISTSAVECVKVLLGDLPPQLPNLKASPEASATMHEVALEQSRYWKSIRPDLNEPEGGTCWSCSLQLETHGCLLTWSFDQQL